MREPIRWSDVFEDGWTCMLIAPAILFGIIIPLILGIAAVSNAWGADGVVVMVVGVGWASILTCYLRGRHHRNLRVAKMVGDEIGKSLR